PRSSPPGTRSPRWTKSTRSPSRPATTSASPLPPASAARTAGKPAGSTSSPGTSTATTSPAFDSRARAIRSRSRAPARSSPSPARTARSARSITSRSPPSRASAARSASKPRRSPAGFASSGPPEPPGGMLSSARKPQRGVLLLFADPEPAGARIGRARLAGVEEAAGQVAELDRDLERFDPLLSPLRADVVGPEALPAQVRVPLEEGLVEIPHERFERHPRRLVAGIAQLVLVSLGVAARVDPRCVIRLLGFEQRRDEALRFLEEGRAAVARADEVPVLALLFEAGRVPPVGSQVGADDEGGIRPGSRVLRRRSGQPVAVALAAAERVGAGCLGMGAQRDEQGEGEEDRDRPKEEESFGAHDISFRVKGGRDD